MPVYTDGYMTEGHVDCGDFINDIILSFPVHSSMSAFSAEVITILAALQHILVSDHRDFYVYTDSKSALESLYSFTGHRHPTVMEILLIKN
ncbi:hypothetical protein TNIN_80041 [Trichonephila inaurata madagascariensis]|uniref:RNase H type-1 domain-containing protein n=1 Tax=Trichonephila inaurata madagascariensis TaxID=2747483 RepID=A0A8X6Y917_9ARAC|nr:hypothetical protein TNIN_80041 [Trichonephila inaurata madagascariensis]